jgi:hypothetical protein
MMVGRPTCQHIKENGKPCRATPLSDVGFCLWHSPDHTEEAAEARRLGGLRRRREKTVAGAYDLEGLHSVDQVRRLLEIAVLDTLGLDNSIARSRALAAIAMALLRTFEVGELQERLAAIEAVLKPRLPKPAIKPRRR